MDGGVGPDPFGRQQPHKASAGSTDIEVLTRMLPIENKLFWLDLKDNPRGRYLKLCEKRSGKRSTVVVPASGVPELVEIFTYFAQTPEGETGLERKMTVDAKTFLFEIGMNARGRFLKLEERQSRGASLLIIPAGQNSSGWIMFCNVLMEFLPHVRDINSADPSTSMPPLLGGPSHDLQGVVHHHAALAGVPDQLQFQQAFQGQQPASPLTVVRSGQKRFFFDIGANARRVPYKRPENVFPL